MSFDRELKNLFRGQLLLASVGTLALLLLFVHPYLTRMSDFQGRLLDQARTHARLMESLASLQEANSIVLAKTVAPLPSEPGSGRNGARERFELALDAAERTTPKSDILAEKLSELKIIGRDALDRAGTEETLAKRRQAWLRGIAIVRSELDQMLDNAALNVSQIESRLDGERSMIVWRALIGWGGFNLMLIALHIYAVRRATRLPPDRTARSECAQMLSLDDLAAAASDIGAGIAMVAKISNLDDLRKKYGHEGKAILTEALQGAIFNSIRKIDFSGRLPDAGFVLIFPHADYATGTRAATRIERHLSEYPPRIPEPIECRVQFGIAKLHPAGFERALENAEEAWFRAWKTNEPFKIELVDAATDNRRDSGRAYSKPTGSDEKPSTPPQDRSAPTSGHAAERALRSDIPGGLDRGAVDPDPPSNPEKAPPQTTGEETLPSERDGRENKASRPTRKSRRKKQKKDDYDDWLDDPRLNNREPRE